MPGYDKWIPESVREELDKRMENAFRRVSGSIGYDISFDGGRSRALKDTASDVLKTGMESVGPMFLRMGRGLYEAKGLKTGPGLSLREIAGEILKEFFDEGSTAFQVGRNSLYADALRHVRGLGVDADHAKAVLSAADGTFVMPSREEFTQAAMPLCSQSFAPSTLAIVGAVAGFAPAVFLLRAPVLAVIGALAVGGLGFYIGRGRQRSAAAAMIQRLPRILYDLLLSGLNANTSRYADTVNSALKKLP